MKLKTWLVGVVVGAAVLQVGMVQAKTDVVVKADNKDDFTAVVAAVHQQMQTGGHYEFTSKKDRDAIDAQFSEMQSLFDKYGTVAQMDPNAKVQLFNDQQAVNAMLTHNDSNRLVCEHIAPLGSNIPKTVCRTYGEIQQEQRDSQHFMNTYQQVPQFKGGH
jgi:predicted RNA-binding protein Jag